MDEVTTTVNQRKSSTPVWKLLLAINLFLGFLLWFGGFTDYSWAGTIADIVFPPVVVVASLISLVAVLVSGKGKRLIILFSCIPSLAGGCSSLILAAILLVPPFTLGTLFMIDEIASESLIQRAISPDGSRTAEVYFRPVGAYSGGNGRIYVRVKHRIFPFVERDVYYLRATYADEETNDYLYWQDNDTLYIWEKQQEVRLGAIRTSIPVLISTPMSVVRFIAGTVEQERADFELSAPAREIPTPDFITDDTYNFSESENVAMRHFNIPGHHPDEIAAWYQEALSQSPWSLVQDKRQVFGSGTIHYCIQAQRTDSDGQSRNYYVEIMGHDDESASVHVNVVTPEYEPCRIYFEQP